MVLGFRCTRLPHKDLIACVEDMSLLNKEMNFNDILLIFMCAVFLTIAILSGLAWNPASDSGLEYLAVQASENKQCNQTHSNPSVCNVDTTHIVGMRNNARLVFAISIIIFVGLFIYLVAFKYAATIFGSKKSAVPEASTDESINF